MIKRVKIIVERASTMVLVSSYSFSRKSLCCGLFFLILLLLFLIVISNMVSKSGLMLSSASAFACALSAALSAGASSVLSSTSSACAPLVQSFSSAPCSVPFWSRSVQFCAPENCCRPDQLTLICSLHRPAVVQISRCWSVPLHRSEVAQISRH